MTVRLTLPGGDAVELRDDVLDIDRARLAELGPCDPVRLVFAAAHIVMLPSYADADPAESAEHVDWVETMRYRRFLADNGFGIAEAMDTAQRFEIGWDTASRLIDETGRLGLDTGFVAGAGIDHVDEPATVGELVEAIAWQCRYISDRGGTPVILSQPWLTARGFDADGFVEVYASIIDAIECEAILHWLGPMFMPALEGNFPGDSMSRILAIDPATIRGMKLSMLDADLERGLRAQMTPRGQLMFTGDDLNFAGLIEGSGEPTGTTTLAGRTVPTGDFSHALLGIFDAIAEPASIALRLLARGDRSGYRRIMEPCEALSRIVFEEPVPHYKAGLVFLAWVNGRQSNPMMINGLEHTRDSGHHQRLLAAASHAGVVHDAALVGRLLGG